MDEGIEGDPNQDICSQRQATSQPDKTETLNSQKVASSRQETEISRWLDITR
jgi:hypothetical protein